MSIDPIFSKNVSPASAAAFTSFVFFIRGSIFDPSTKEALASLIHTSSAPACNSSGKSFIDRSSLTASQEPSPDVTSLTSVFTPPPAALVVAPPPPSAPVGTTPPIITNAGATAAVLKTCPAVFIRSPAFSLSAYSAGGNLALKLEATSSACSAVLPAVSTTFAPASPAVCLALVVASDAVTILSATRSTAPCAAAWNPCALASRLTPTVFATGVRTFAPALDADTSPISRPLTKALPHTPKNCCLFLASLACLSISSNPAIPSPTSAAFEILPVLATIASALAPALAGNVALAKNSAPLPMAPINNILDAVPCSVESTTLPHFQLSPAFPD